MCSNKDEAGVYAPHYYSTFKCTADQCRHSCCVGWEICIDEMTYAKYQQIGDIMGTVQMCEDGPCFTLCEDGRCPHLCDTGLCNIILRHGEDCLSDICRNHPRFFNEINSGRTEAGLGIVCEEACRLILTDETPFSLSLIERYDDDVPGDSGFDPLPQRDRMISLAEGAVSFDDALAALRTAYALPALYTMEAWLPRLLSLEILEADWERDLRTVLERRSPFHGTGVEDCDGSYVRLLIYFIYRHVSTADNEKNLRARLAFSMLSAETVRFLFEVNQRQPSDRDSALYGLMDWARRYSAEIEYSEENTEALILAFESKLRR